MKSMEVGLMATAVLRAFVPVESVRGVTLESQRLGVLGANLVIGHRRHSSEVDLTWGPAATRCERHGALMIKMKALGGAIDTGESFRVSSGKSSFECSAGSERDLVDVHVDAGFLAIQGGGPRVERP